MQGPETDQHEVTKLKNAITEGREETVIIKNYRKDGTTFWNRVQLSPLRDNNNQVMLIVGLQSQVYRDPSQSKSSFTSREDRKNRKKSSNNHGNGSSGSGSTTGSDGMSGICSGSDGNNDSDRDQRRTHENHHQHHHDDDDDGTGK